MDSTFLVSWTPVLVNFLILDVCLCIGAATAFRIREPAAGYWVLGWAAMVLCGAMYLIADAGYPSANYFGFVADALFAPLMFVGAACLGGRSMRAWPIAVGVVAGGVRGVLDAGGFIDAMALVATVVAPAFLIGAAVLVARTPERPAFRSSISLLLILSAIEEVWDGWLDWTNTGNVVPWTAVIAVSVPLAAFQIASRLVAIQRLAVTARRRSDLTEEERDLEQWRFKTIFDHARDLVAEISHDSRILYVNARARDLLGLDPNDVIGKTLFDFVPSPHRAEARSLWPELISGAENSITAPALNSAGKEIYLEFRASRYEFPNELRLVVFARDVTDRILNERELDQYRQDLEQRVAERSEELKESRLKLRDQERLATVGTLAAGIAHQINNPVGLIVAAAEFALLSDGEPDRDEIRRQSLLKAVEEAHRIGRIVKSVLKFARHESTPKWCEDIGPIVHRSSELSRPYVEARGGSLKVASPIHPLPVMLSPIEIEQVMVNLIHNAVESRVEGGHVQVRTRRVSDAVEIEVEDNGRGIDPESLQHIFDPFYTTRLREGGSGLGLSVVHGVVVDHGGEVVVESELGAGTCMRVRLPLVLDSPT